VRNAAAVLVIFSVSYGAWYMTRKNSGDPEAISKNVIAKIILNDGSLVWLRTGSHLVYYEKPEDSIRYAELNGDALFEVAKDSSHPFVIRCGEASLRVLGTSFSVRMVSDSLELKVLTGKVNFSLATKKASVDVEPNERLIFNKVNGEMEKFSMDKKEVPAIIADTEYNMLFTNATLEEVIKSISKKFDVAIELRDKQAGKCRITADFTDHSLESTLKMITEVLDVGYSRNGSDIKIDGTGCN
jgi:ferric-dicitrate binding protein FerR (iron transport regulator)